MDAPDFELCTMDGEERVRLQDYKGKPLMLTFWASWCPDSQKDLAQKQTFYKHLDSEQLTFLTINVSGREGRPEDPSYFMEKNQYTFPVLLDEKTKTYDRFRCMGVPTTFILDEDLNIVNRFNDKAAFLEIMNGMKEVLET